MNKIKVLHFEDDQNQIKSVKDFCNDEYCEYESISQYIPPKVIIDKILHLRGQVFVITDEHLAKEAMMDGGTVASAIKGAYPDVPIIIYTGDPTKASQDIIRIKSRAKERKKETGVLEVITKGDDPQKLIDAIKTCIRVLQNATTSDTPKT